MAEFVVGVFSAGVGIAAFAHQIATHIHNLRSIRKFNRGKAPAEIRQLLADLESLEQIASGLGDYDFPAAWNPLPMYTLADINTSIQQLVAKLEGSQSGRWDRLKSGFSREAKEGIEEVRGRIRHVISVFTLSISLLNLVQDRRCRIHTQLQDTAGGSSELALPENNSSTISEVEQPTIAFHKPDHDPKVYRTLSRRKPKITPPSCGIRLCSCSCHAVQQHGGRLWYLHYTRLSVFFRNCDSQWCSSARIWLAARLSLWKLGIPWAISGSFEFLTNNTCRLYKINPSLSITSVVPYTAPAFQTLWYLQNSQISAPEAKERLIQLYQTDRSIVSHVNPSGEDCIQWLLCYGPWNSQNAQFEMLRLFLYEFGVSLKDRDQGFLTHCAWWIGEGRHIDLLDYVLEGGFDPSLIDSPLFEEWPAGCSSGWINERLTPDPFFVDYLATISRRDDDFSGFHPVHHLVLSRSVDHLEDFVSRYPHSLEGARTFLGQTALHLAVDNIELVRCVLHAGHAIEVTDKWGATPLMYASARGRTDTAKLLISKGANLITASGIENRDFLDFALFRGHHKLAMQALEKIKSEYGQETFEVFTLRALLKLIGVSRREWKDSSWEYSFDFLARNCGNVNFTFGDSYHGTERNNFMHYVKSPSDAKTLIELGYDGFAQANNKGELATHALVETRNADLLRICFDNGADVDHQDGEHHTVLLKCVTNLNSSGSLPWGVVETIRACLEHGADIFVGDQCQCSCAPDGCSITSAFSMSLGLNSLAKPGPVWTLEWLSLVQEYRGTEALRKTLLQFLRRAAADDIGVTHLCCHRGHGFHSATQWRLSEIYPVPPEDAVEILEEEEELVLRLEEEALPIALESVEQLMSRWIRSLAESHKKYLQLCQEEWETSRSLRNKSGNKGYFVDREKDKYHYPVYDLSFFGGPHEMEAQAAEYSLWLEHELAKRKAAQTAISVAAEWYERRRFWLAELVRAVDVREADIACRIKEIYIITETSIEEVDRTACARNFLRTGLDAQEYLARQNQVG